MLFRIKSKRMAACRACLVVAGVVTGCAEPTTWRVQAPDESLATSELTADDLGIANNEPTAQMGQSPSKAPISLQFPTGVAIARVSATSDVPGKHSMRVVADRTDREAFWSQLFNDLSLVREVAILGRHGMNPNGSKREEILRKARSMECNLCVIYARIEGVDCETGSEYAAVLWETNQSRQLAEFRVPVPSDEADSHDDNADNVAEARLREQVRQSVWELAQKHAPSIQTKPSPWRSSEPIFPRGRERYYQHDHDHSRP